MQSSTSSRTGTQPVRMRHQSSGRVETHADSLITPCHMGKLLGKSKSASLCHVINWNQCITQLSDQIKN